MHSYVTLQEAEEYFKYLMTYEKWVSFSEDLQERALTTASFQIDTLNFTGYKAAPDQEMEFPRVGKPLNDYELIKYQERLANLEIPKTVKKATCEQALYILTNQQSGANYEQMQAQNITSYTIGDVSIDFDLNRYSRLQVLCSTAQGLLDAYIKRYTRLI